MNCRGTRSRAECAGKTRRAHAFEWNIYPNSAQLRSQYEAVRRKQKETQWLCNNHRPLLAASKLILLIRFHMAVEQYMHRFVGEALSAIARESTWNRTVSAYTFSIIIPSAAAHTPAAAAALLLVRYMH